MRSAREGEASRQASREAGSSVGDPAPQTAALRSAPFDPQAGARDECGPLARPQAAAPRDSPQLPRAAELYAAAARLHPGLSWRLF